MMVDIINQFRPLMENTTLRRVQRVRYELRRREVTVARTEHIGGFARIVFGGEALADFTSGAFDDHVKFFFQPAGAPEPIGRDYTPRAFDRERRELTIEFALHGGGPACEWARQAKPGQPALVGGPRGSFIVPADYDWHLLAGDSSALPAIHRRLEELPANTRAIVRVLVHDAAEQRALRSAAELDLQWARTPQGLIHSIEALVLPQGDGFAWCAGEASAMARLRHVLLTEKQHPREAARIAAYWKLGASGHHENLE
jgi:NADPH-dependent ferric siderophore reductase